jgi:hypothetical protein
VSATTNEVQDIAEVVFLYLVSFSSSNSSIAVFTLVADNQEIALS